MTVVAVLHQPRYEILRLCDDIMLLAKGGHTVYSGTVRNAPGYFSELGFTCPSYVNPADFLLDITAGSVPVDTDGEAHKRGTNCAYILLTVYAYLYYLCSGQRRRSSSALASARTRVQVRLAVAGARGRRSAKA